MPIPEKYLANFEEHGIYHVYNRTNNKEKLFLSDENRYFFLKKYSHYLSPFIDTYCWCLLPNHFHFLVRIKSEKEIYQGIDNKGLQDQTISEKRFRENLISLSEIIEFSFKRFFQSYSLAFNKSHKRKGNLFYKPFKRVVVKKERHFTQTIIYIHANAVKHRIVKDFSAYKWSSWNSILSDAPTQLLRNEVIDWFGGKKQMIKDHFDLVTYYYETETLIED